MIVWYYSVLIKYVNTFSMLNFCGMARKHVHVTKDVTPNEQTIDVSDILRKVILSV